MSLKNSSREQKAKGLLSKIDAWEKLNELAQKKHDIYPTEHTKELLDYSSKTIKKLENN